MTNITISLPDDLVTQARSAGLLDDEVLAALIRDAVRRKTIDGLFTSMKVLSEVKPVLSEAEINAEIEEFRAERARRR